MPSPAELLALARASTSPPLQPFEQRLERDVAQPLLQSVGALTAVYVAASSTTPSPSNAPPQSTATTVLEGISLATQTLTTGLSVASAVGELPLTMIDTATAVISNALIPPGLGFSALGPFDGVHLSPPHGHMHPPSLVPPAPAPIPLPSMGMAVGMGCVSVLIGGLPAMRTGDFGVALTCGSFGPTFEVITGSASVYIGGKRAARLGDFTRICNPLPAAAVASAVQGAMTAMSATALALPIINDMVAALHATSVSADSSAAASEEADPNEAASLAQAGVAQAAEAAGQMQSALLGAAQIAADAASFAATALVGADPGIPPGMGITLGTSRPVLIGGLPMPPSQVVSSAISNALRRLRQRRRRVTESAGEFHERATAAPHPDANGLHACAGDPVHVVRGAVLMSSLDSDLGGLLRFSRHYDTDQRGRVGACGRGVRHFYERELHVALDRCVYISEAGVTIEFPAFRGRDELTHFGARIVRERAEATHAARYRVRHQGVDMIFIFSQGDSRLARLTQMSSAEGRVLLGYTEQGLLEAVQATRGTLRFRYDDNLLIRKIDLEDSRGRRGACDFSYDLSHRLVRAVDARGSEEAYAYDEAHNLTTRWDATNYPFYWRYDEAQRCVWTSGHGGHLETHFRYETGTTHVTTPNGGTRLFRHNAHGVLTRIEGPEGSSLEREISALQWCLSERDEAGREVEWLYDSTGKHVARRDRFGNRLPPGTLDSGFDARAPELPATLAGQLGRTALDVADVRVASGIDPGLLSLIPPALQPFVVPAFQLRSGTAAPLPEPERDLLGQVTARPSARHAWAFSYDAVGNPISLRDRDGAEVHLHYAHRTLPQRRTDGNGHHVELAHTASGHIARLTDGLGSKSEYVYTQAGRVETILRHGQGWESYGYRAGVLVEKKDSLGQTLLTIDVGTNALPKCVRLASGESYTLAYDARGKTVEASSSKHDVRLRYDEHSRRIADRRDGRGITHRRDPSSAEGRTEHTFLERFRWLSFRASQGDREVITLVLGKETIRFERHPGVAIRTCSGGARELLQFREDGHLVAQAIFHEAPSKSRWASTTQYERSAEGDILAILDSARGERRFTMDNAHRLLGEHVPSTGRTTHYVLDAADNLRQSRHVLSAEFAVGNILLRADDESFAHDHRGRLATRTRNGVTIRYAYDSWDQLVSVREGQSGLAASQSAPDPDWHARYDGLGRRLSFGRRGRTTQLYWDGDRIAGEVASSGRVRVYLYLDETALIPVAFVDYASESAPAESAALHHIFCDATGMPQHIERAGGEIVWRALETDAYGSLVVDPKSTIDYNLRWPGHYFDQDTGLHYNRYRDYDPKLGRYLEPDPMGHAGGINLYAYSKNPLVEVDLLGLYTACRVTAFISYLESIGRPLAEDLRGDGDQMIAAWADGIMADYAVARRTGDSRQERALELEFAQVTASMGYGSRHTQRDRVDGPSPDASRTPRTAEREAVLTRAREAHMLDSGQATRTHGRASEADHQLARAEGNTPEQVIARRNVIAGFVPEGRLGSHLGGHDLSQPVFTGPPPPMTGVLTSTQPSVNGQPPRPEPGEYLARASDGFTPDEVGIDHAGDGQGFTRAPKAPFAVTYPEDKEYLQSVCNPTDDTWSGPTAVWTGGGGIQVVFVRLWVDGKSVDNGVYWAPGVRRP